MNLTEGGNVFKDAAGRPLTQRINLPDIKPTILWLERVTGLPLIANTLGTTGLKSSSGDLDLAVDSTQVDKAKFAQKLVDYVIQNGQDPAAWVRKSGTAVHFRTPIRGQAGTGFVQTDFMFMPKPDFSKFILRQDPASKYKGATRNILINSIAKSMGYKLNQLDGIADRTTNQLITDDPDQIARLLLNPRATSQDLASVERIMAALAQDPKRDAKLADFRAHMEREGTPLAENADVDTEVSWLARLRDRIVNQGMTPLIENTTVQEAAETSVGGRAKGIEHLEDLVFRAGLAGVSQALDIVKHVADNPGSTTVKWDGKPAVIFGRKPDTGEFVLTDVAGFTAKGYDGLATSPDQMAQIQQARSGERGELIAIYRRLWPMLEAATPDNFRGYVQGDLLYTQTPPLTAGNYVFRPNTVEYRIPAASGLGQRIAASEVGVAMHTMYSDTGEPKQPLRRVRFNEVPGLLLLEPILAKTITPNADVIKQIRAVAASADGRAIATVFNPAELRAQQITDLARLCVDYINYRIATGNYNDLLPGFGDWLQQNVTPRKFANIVEYLQSPPSNTGAMAAAFTLFLLLHELKTDLLQQLDQQVPGNEGWVMATPHGYAKAVNRFDFTARNRARNNP